MSNKFQKKVQKFSITHSFHCLCYLILSLIPLTLPLTA